MAGTTTPRKREHFSGNTNLPIEFITSTKQAIAPKTQQLDLFADLPFVSSKHKANKAWDVPALGGFNGGRETGEALALMFLKHLRQAPTELSRAKLYTIVQSMMQVYQREDGNLNESKRVVDYTNSYVSFKGQCSGFFETLSIMLTEACHKLSTNLDDLNVSDLTIRANAGIFFDEDAYLSEVA